MKNANECAPKTCKCKSRLPKIVSGFPWKDEKMLRLGIDYPHHKSPTSDSKVWYTHCNKCDTTYVWSWHPESNGCWMIRSINPLFDSKEIVYK